MSINFNCFICQMTSRKTPPFLSQINGHQSTTSLLLLLSLRASWDSAIASHPVIRFPRFGFSAHGDFEILVVGDREYVFHMLLLDSDEAEFHRRGYINPLVVCNNTYARISRYNFSTKIAMRSFRWVGSVSEADVYAPVLVNCGFNGTAKYDAAVRYSNLGSELDMRDDGIIECYCVLAFGYIMLGTCWIINILTHGSFHMNIHGIFAVIPLLKALSLSISAKTLYAKKFADVSYNRLTGYDDVCFCVFASLFILSIIIGSSGLDVIRSELGSDERMTYPLVSVLFSFSLGMFHRWGELQAIIVLMILALAVNILHTISEFLLAAYRLRGLTNDKRVLEKANLLVNFIVAMVITLALIFGIELIAFLKDVWNFHRVIIIEGVVFLSCVAQAVLYMVRDIHTGPKTFQRRATVAEIEEPDGHTNLVFLS